MMYQLDVTKLNSDDAVNEARVQLKISKSRYQTMLVLCYMFAVFAVAGCVAAGVVAHRTHEAPSLGMALLIAVAVGAALMWGSECDQRGLSAYWALGDLAALSGTADKCKDALALCASSPAAEAVREKALASGRQLYMFDYSAMCAATEQQARETTAANHDAVCRELHGLAA
jgi:hypothetical protein